MMPHARTLRAGAALAARALHHTHSGSAAACTCALPPPQAAAVIAAQSSTARAGQRRHAIAPCHRRGGRGGCLSAAPRRAASTHTSRAPLCLLHRADTPPHPLRARPAAQLATLVQRTASYHPGGLILGSVGSRRRGGGARRRLLGNQNERAHTPLGEYIGLPGGPVRASSARGACSQGIGTDTSGRARWAGGTWGGSRRGVSPLRAQQNSTHAYVPLRTIARARPVLVRITPRVCRPPPAADAL